MKILKLLNYLMLIVVFLSPAFTSAQNHFYTLKPVKNVETNSTKDQLRVGTCWSNAGAAFLEAEMLRTGKPAVDISIMDFVHNIYLKKASVFFSSDEMLRVDPSGIAFDVFSLAREYGMAPESAYMYPEKEMMGSREKEGEMDAILRGTLTMVKQRGEGFTEKWENVYNTSLLRYMGETKIEFDYKDKKYTPQTFAEYSGLSMENYVLLTSDAKSPMNKPIEMDFKENWAKHQFYNVSLDDLTSVITKSIEGGYSVLWYGIVQDGNIYETENMALVPAGDMPGVKSQGENQAETEYKPVPEMKITDEMRSQLIGKNISSEQDYLLIYGISNDQDGASYFVAKYVCKSGDKVLNLSLPFTKLNTIYLMVNKDSMPGNVKSSLGL
ncbi:MAG: hypothetical protein K9H16_03935 [Bacteroidales bacterium]|nr:hypothetical protein [Bacteroidales bacterium]